MINQIIGAVHGDCICIYLYRMQMDVVMTGNFSCPLSLFARCGEIHRKLLTRAESDTLDYRWCSCLCSFPIREQCKEKIHINPSTKIDFAAKKKPHKGKMCIQVHYALHYWPRPFCWIVVRLFIRQQLSQQQREEKTVWIAARDEQTADAAVVNDCPDEIEF